MSMRFDCQIYYLFKVRYLFTFEYYPVMLLSNLIFIITTKIPQISKVIYSNPNTSICQVINNFAPASQFYQSITF